MKMAGGKGCLSSFFTNISPPCIKCSSMYCAKYMSSVVFFLCSLGASSMFQLNTRLLKSLYWIYLQFNTKDILAHLYHDNEFLSRVFRSTCYVLEMDGNTLLNKYFELFVSKDTKHLYAITSIMYVDMAHCYYTVACNCTWAFAIVLPFIYNLLSTRVYSIIIFYEYMHTTQHMHNKMSLAYFPLHL